MIFRAFKCHRWATKLIFICQIVFCVFLQYQKIILSMLRENSDFNSYTKQEDLIWCFSRHFGCNTEIYLQGKTEQIMVQSN